jgi:hypothetical protein
MTIGYPHFYGDTDTKRWDNFLVVADSARTVVCLTIGVSAPLDAILDSLESIVRRPPDLVLGDSVYSYNVWYDRHRLLGAEGTRLPAEGNKGVWLMALRPDQYERLPAQLPLCHPPR